MKILVTGVAGFIGRAIADRFLRDGHVVVGIDNLNAYYSVNLKLARLDTLRGAKNFVFAPVDVADSDALKQIFSQHIFDVVLHMAAQAGVRYSIESPETYTSSNLVGFANILEMCRRSEVGHLVYASSSSVYGRNSKVPFSESDPVDHPVSYYAATKRANEVMAESYASLYGLGITGLRFFTVYGPWGRPDMAPWLFVAAVLEGRPIKVFNNGQMARDFTYIDDIVEGVVRVAKNNPIDRGEHRIFNIGNNTPIPLMDFISTVEVHCGKQALKEFFPMQDGDVPVTFANTKRLEELVAFSPSTPLHEGMGKFVQWFREFHGLE